MGRRHTGLTRSPRGDIVLNMENPTQSIQGATPTGIAELRYQTGFGNEFATEALVGALPMGQNSPQRTPFGLYAELLSGTAFTAPRSRNRRTWTYRIRPSASHSSFDPHESRTLSSTPFDQSPTSPDRLRWDPLPLLDNSQHVDFLEGLHTYAGNGNIEVQVGCAAHLYSANVSMRRYSATRTANC